MAAAATLPTKKEYLFKNPAGLIMADAHCLDMTWL